MKENDIKYFFFPGLDRPTETKLHPFLVKAMYLSRKSFQRRFLLQAGLILGSNFM